MTKAQILIVAAHPDDEVLGCGGTILRHVEEGNEVRILILADGESSRNKAGSMQNRIDASFNAAKILGVSPPVHLQLHDNRLDTYPLLDIVQMVEEHVALICPNIIYTHHGNDLNVDHRLVHQAVLTACRPQPSTKVEAIYGFETMSSTEWSSPDTAPAFRPTRFVNITRYLTQKLSALRAYESEMRPYPHARSFEAARALASVRGATVGLEAAEAFSVIREVYR
jgi:N-acetylglucosamine malate deacetylase 1